jgi:hypothetical protein
LDRDCITYKVLIIKYLKKTLILDGTLHIGRAPFFPANGTPTIPNAAKSAEPRPLPAVSARTTPALIDAA